MAEEEEEGGDRPHSPAPAAVDRMIPGSLTPEEYHRLHPVIQRYHTYDSTAPGQCSSLIVQRIAAPPDIVWSVVRRFDRPQVYKHFIKSCRIRSPGSNDLGEAAESSVVAVGWLREVTVVSGLPANTSVERLDVLDEERRVTGFSIIGGEHRLRNYRSTTTVNGDVEGSSTVVVESYVVDVPEGNTEEDTRLFADTVVKLNLQQLGSVSQAAAASAVRKEKEEEVRKD